jgi:hypothetical protein
MKDELIPPPYLTEWLEPVQYTSQPYGPIISKHFRATVPLDPQIHPQCHLPHPSNGRFHNPLRKTIK